MKGMDFEIYSAAELRKKASIELAIFFKLLAVCIKMFFIPLF